MYIFCTLALCLPAALLHVLHALLPALNLAVGAHHRPASFPLKPASTSSRYASHFLILSAPFVPFSVEDFPP